jgi:outer membrane protein OmpA-like peptidoglycan-associated protein
MKKVLIMVAAALLTASANAQTTTITSNKFGDNWYVGIHGGTAFTSTIEGDDATAFKGLAPNVALRVGKNLTTVFGLALDANAYFKANDKSTLQTKTFINATDINLLGTFNLSNLFAGYKGQPRTFEVIALGGFGWTHGFGIDAKENGITSRLALDFAFNLGEKKAWQLYIEPAITYGMEGYYNSLPVGNGFKYNLENSMLQINLGLNYKFPNSNGTHNFAIESLRDLGEINMLNARINDLRADNEVTANKLEASKREIINLQEQIEDLQAQLKACEEKPRPAATVVVKKSLLQPIVIFGQGKSTIDAAQYASVEMVAKYMRNHPESKILIKGYASPEGDAQKNLALSIARAESVKNALINRYKIAASRLTTEGMGATAELSEENDFNRVAMFFDTTME